MSAPDLEALIADGWKVTSRRQGNWLIAERRGQWWFRWVVAPDAEALLAHLAIADREGWDRDDR